MKSILTFVTFLICIVFVSQAQAVTFDWAIIGNPGNTSDTNGNGDVDYYYRMGKHEVTNTQYTEFLNAVAVTDQHELYHISMGTVSWGGITRSGTTGNYTYAVRESAVGQGPNGTDYAYANKPASYVSYINAMRFVNWLENGQPNGVQSDSTTEDGVYGITNGFSEVRKPEASFFIPSLDEWYKAAYHKNDGVTDEYWNYPTTIDTIPDNSLPEFDTGHSANFWKTVHTTCNFNYSMTDVGAYTHSGSAYGTFDQGGNVMEFTESRNGSFRRVWGGTSLGDHVRMQSSHPGHFVNPNSSVRQRGFRVASIPEPSSLLIVSCMAIFIFLSQHAVWRAAK